MTPTERRYTRKEVEQMVREAWGDAYTGQPNSVRYDDSNLQLQLSARLEQGEQTSGAGGAGQPDTPETRDNPLTCKAAPAPDSTIDVGADYVRLTAGTVIEETDWFWDDARGIWDCVRECGWVLQASDRPYRRRLPDAGAERKESDRVEAIARYVGGPDDCWMSRYRAEGVQPNGDGPIYRWLPALSDGKPGWSRVKGESA